METDSGPCWAAGRFFYLYASRRKPNCGTILLMDILTRSGAETAWIVDRAKAEGFDLCGVVRAEKFPELAHTPEWLQSGYYREMKHLPHPPPGGSPSGLQGDCHLLLCAVDYKTPQPLSTIA